MRASVSVKERVGGAAILALVLIARMLISSVDPHRL